ncbi:MAG: ankyrin repeat domain-containing protein [Spirochaetales bacterium]|nr:ankyrin repeat domain-containing protein [Spirochaetales bacterium]
MKHIKNLIILFAIALIISSCASTEVRAVRKGDLQELEKFLSKGGDPNEVDKDGNGLIHVAVQFDQADSLQRLLIAGANPNLLNRTGNTALILAVQKNAFNMTDILINSGGNVSITGSNGRSTLMIAAANGNVQMMEQLLSEGAELDLVDNSGLSALFYSVSGNNLEGLSFLINSGADAGKIDNKGRTPLHLLTQNGQKAFARMLIQAGADPSHQQSSSGETPLHIASGSGAWELVEEYLSDKSVLQQINLLSTQPGAPLFYALNPELSLQSAVNTMGILLEAGADPNIASVQDVLPIVHAVEKLDASRVELLVDWGAKLNNHLAEEKTFLHTAASRKLPKLVSVLLKAGIDPDLRDKQGNTALFIAVRGADVETVELLLVSGAEPDIINNDGETVLYITLKRDGGQKNGISGETSLLLRYRASLPSGKKILSELLLRTIDSGNAEVAEILLKAGANPNERVQDGMTLLMLSSSSRFVELSKVLIIKGAGINMWDKNGNTSMHFATGAGSVEGVELLLRYGEHPDRLNNEDLRPIQLAPPNDQGLKIIEILLAAGARPVPLKTEPEAIESEEETPPPADEEVVINEEQTDLNGATEGTVTSEESAESVNNSDKDNNGEPIKNVEWGKAKVLYTGEREPRKVSGDRITFEDFSAMVPRSYPQNLYSKSNKREVIIYIRNETRVNAEIYFVSTTGIIEAVEALPSGGFIRMETQEGNVYPVYTYDNNYFGEIQTTGQDVQYFRLVEKE